MSSITLPPSTALQASSKGLKLYLAIDTNLNDDVKIITHQYDLVVIVAWTKNCGLLIRKCC